MNSLDDIDQDEDKSQKWNIKSVKPYFMNPEKMLREYRKIPGSSVILKCNVYSELEINITWYKNEQKIYNKNGFDEMSLNNLSKTDNGRYKCVACNSNACIQYTFKIDVIGKKFPFEKHVSYV